MFWVFAFTLRFMKHFVLFSLFAVILAACIGFEQTVTLPETEPVSEGASSIEDDGGFSADSSTFEEPENDSGFSADSSTSTDSEIPDGDVATVVNVIDGDTIDVELNGIEYRVRYVGVDTPERDEPYYREATGFNRDLVANETIILVQDVSETDRFGRLLRYVYLEDGTFVNAELIAGGFARTVTFPPDVAQTDYFQDLQRAARNDNLGLWGIADFSDGVAADAPASCNICTRNAYNCSDFNTQAAAQACYEFCFDVSGEDIHRMDGGGDGQVCESLP